MAARMVLAILLTIQCFSTGGPMPPSIPFPKELYDGPISMSDAFAKVARALGDSPEVAASLFALLPVELRRARAIYPLLTRHWSYEFGTEFVEMPEDFILFGSPQFPQLDHLYQCLKVAQKH